MAKGKLKVTSTATLKVGTLLVAPGATVEIDEREARDLHQRRLVTIIESPAAAKRTKSKASGGEATGAPVLPPPAEPPQDPAAQAAAVAEGYGDTTVVDADGVVHEGGEGFNFGAGQ